MRPFFTLVWLLSISLVWGGDVWEEKSFREWTREEAVEVLKESPWVTHKRLNLHTSRAQSVSPWIEVTWVAAPIRQAFFRLAQLDGHNEPEPPEETGVIQFFIRGPVLRLATARGDEGSIQENSYLRLKESGEEIRAGQVEFGRGFPSDPLLVVAFPRRTEEGKENLAGQSEVELVLGIAGKTVKSKFKLRDLLIDEEPAF